MTQTESSEAQGQRIHEKTLGKKSRDTVPLINIFYETLVRQLELFQPKFDFAISLWLQCFFRI